MAKIAVAAPVYINNNEHLDFAKLTMNSVYSAKHQLDRIAVINKVRNDSEDLDWVKANFDYFEYNDENIVARAWNKAIDRAFERGNDYVLLINLDICLRLDSIDNLVEIAQHNPNCIIWSSWMWEDVATLDQAKTVDESLDDAHFSCFMVDKRLMEQVGRFDENFRPVYGEDADMRWRIRLKKLPMMMTKLSWFYHLENGVAKCSQVAKTEDFFAINEGLHKGDARYLKNGVERPTRKSLPFRLMERTKTKSFPN